MEHEPIWMDGVDVSGCSVYKKGKCLISKAKCNARCDYGAIYLKEQLARKTQECENLKAEEKYLKQCCEKAGKELTKHSFDYDGKEKNLVVQAMELNEKYEKLEKALEEIETELSHGFTTMVFYRVLDIINEAKGEGNE